MSEHHQPPIEHERLIPDITRLPIIMHVLHSLKADLEGSLQHALKINPALSRLLDTDVRQYTQQLPGPERIRRWHDLQKGVVVADTVIRSTALHSYAPLDGCITIPERVYSQIKRTTAHMHQQYGHRADTAELTAEDLRGLADNALHHEGQLHGALRAMQQFLGGGDYFIFGAGLTTLTYRHAVVPALN